MTGFFDPVIQWLDSAWKTLWKFVQMVWNYFREFYVWIVGILYGLVVVTDRVFHAVSEMIAFLATAFGHLSVPTEAGQSAEITLGSIPQKYLAFANAFAPVEEGLALLSAYMLFLIAGTAYRFVKSWIPTLS